jgi:hypothetical protein
MTTMTILFEPPLPVTVFLRSACGSRATRVVRANPSRVQTWCVECGQVAWVADDVDDAEEQAGSAITGA